MMMKKKFVAVALSAVCLLSAVYVLTLPFKT